MAFLTALVAAILVRALRADLSRYNNNGNGNGIGVGSSSSSSSSPSRLDLDLGGLDGDFDDETGWKVLSGDVFRTPKRLPLLSALVGTGAQLCLLAFLTSAAAAARGSSLFEDRGSVATVAVVLYALTSVVGGFVAGETFTRFSSNGGSSGGGGSLGGRAGSSTTATTSKRAQARTWLLAATLLPLSSLAVGAFVNSVALLYRSSAAVPFRGVAGVSALWLLLSAPLCRLGFAAGRKRWQRRRLGEAAGGGRAGDPTRTKRVPSPIPSKPWHRSRAFVCLLAGLLPFLSILVVRRKREERKEREREREKRGKKGTDDNDLDSFFSKKRSLFPLLPSPHHNSNPIHQPRKRPLFSPPCGTTRSLLPPFFGLWSPLWGSYSQPPLVLQSSLSTRCSAPRTTGGIRRASWPGAARRCTCSPTASVTSSPAPG